MQRVYLEGRDVVNDINRRNFLKKSGALLTGSLAVPSFLNGADYRGETLQVWSCGGLAEAFIPANLYFEGITKSSINYSGAFAAALGKSLLGNARTEVFAPRVLGLSKKLKAQGKLLSFVPLCYTKYVLITPKGNKSGITTIDDLAKPGIKVVLSPNASPPGGGATLAIMKKAGVLEKAKANAIHKGDCVQRDVNLIINGEGDAAIVEKRITCLPSVKGKVESFDIPEEYIPAKPVPFVIGIMKWVKNRDLAENFIKFITSEKGQSYFTKSGFISAISDEGKRLTEKYGVRDE